MQYKTNGLAWKHRNLIFFQGKLTYILFSPWMNAWIIPSCTLNRQQLGDVWKIWCVCVCSDMVDRLISLSHHPSISTHTYSKGWTTWYTYLAVFKLGLLLPVNGLCIFMFSLNLSVCFTLYIKWIIGSYLISSSSPKFYVRVCRVHVFLNVHTIYAPN